MSSFIKGQPFFSSKDLEDLIDILFDKLHPLVLCEYILFIPKKKTFHQAPKEGLGTHYLNVKS